MKKIIWLMFVTVLPLMAFKLDVKDKINSKCLTNIIKNGWSEKNKTLNNLIVKNAEKNLDSFNRKIKHPLIGEKGRDKYGMPKLPKINLDRDDITLMLSYVKYLEKNGRKREAKDMYLNILNGLKNNKEITNTVIKIIVDIVYQSFVVDALNQAIKEETFSTEDKKELCVLAKKALIINKDEFIEAMKLENETVDKVWEKTSFDDAKKYFRIGVNYSNSTQGAFMKDIGNKIKKYNKIYYKKLFAAIDSEDTKDFERLEEYIKKEKESISSICSKIKLFLGLVVINVRASFGVTIKDFGYVSTLLAKKLVFVAMPKVKATFFDYKKQVEANKRLLKDLGCE